MWIVTPNRFPFEAMFDSIRVAATGINSSFRLSIRSLKWIRFRFEYIRLGSIFRFAFDPKRSRLNVASVRFLKCDLFFYFDSTRLREDWIRIVDSHSIRCEIDLSSIYIRISIRFSIAISIWTLCLRFDSV